MRVSGVTPSQNVYDRMHWAKKHQLRNEWYEKVRYEIGTRSPRNDRRAFVKITRVSNRLIDPLNTQAGCKYILDALVEFGHLRGDAFKDIDIQVTQRKCKKGEECMEIDIHEIPELD